MMGKDNQQVKEWGEMCWAEGETWTMVVRGRHSIVGSVWLESVAG